MAIEDITRDAVQAVLVEHDRLGLEVFCEQYGFERTREFVITENGHKYGTGVIAAAAHGRLTGRFVLRPGEVADNETVNRRLELLGFQVSELRPPPWTREELVLACELLFDNDRKALRATDQPVKELSALLQRLPFHPPEHRGRKFRSTSSVQRKLYDLMTRLPTYDNVETRAGRLDREILSAFLDDEAAMRAEAAAIRSQYTPAGAWALFAARGERKYGGNSGYADVMGVQYVYDNKVANHQRVGVGDLVVIRDDVEVHGVGRIHRIERQAGVTKLRRVCPTCGSGRFDERKVQRPRFRCRTESCRMEFDEPLEKSVEVTQFVASYGGSWRPLDGAVEPEDLKAILKDRADQNAIRLVDQSKLEDLLSQLVVHLPATRTHVDARTVGQSPRGGHRVAETKVRNGQGPFRKELLKRYGSMCAVTGACPVEVLQAAHIVGFAESETHNLDEGVLLRADVHLLFDNNLLAIDPDTWRVVLAPALGAYPRYMELEGARFIEGPSPKAIREHFNNVTATWI